jgi:CRISPR system Cascade subunit CasD
MGARIEQIGERFTDYQTALLYEKDQGWTTRGEPEGRASSPSYTRQTNGQKALTWQRYRDYHADLAVLIALRLEPSDESPTLDDLAEALDRPVRPLFIGRKPCLPVGRLFAGWVEAENILQALQKAPAITKRAALSDPWLLQWPDGEGQAAGDRVLDLCDERNWTSGVHGGWRPVRQVAINTGGE